MNEQKNSKKKVYSPPTITDHGKVVEETKGMTSTAWEVFGHTVPDDGSKGNG